MANILLIEPDRQLAEIYRQALSDQGHSVVPCAGAQAAIMAADQTRPDVVLLELQLVGHSGIEFLYEFRSYTEWRTIPVVIHSQVPPSEFNINRQLLRNQLGVQHYLYKPTTSLHDLSQAVQAYAPVKA